MVQLLFARLPQFKDEIRYSSIKKVLYIKNWTNNCLFYIKIEKYALAHNERSE
jgi:hypothetical protein